MATHLTPAQKRKSASLKKSLQGFTATEALRLGKIASGKAPKGAIKQLLIDQQRRLGLIPPDPPTESSATRPPPTEPTGFPTVTPVGPAFTPDNPQNPRRGFTPDNPPPSRLVNRNQPAAVASSVRRPQASGPPPDILPFSGRRKIPGFPVSPPGPGLILARQEIASGGALGTVPANTETRSKPRRRRSTTGPRPAPRTLQDKIRSIRRQRQNLFA